MASRFSSGPPHKLSSIISSLLTQRQPGQVNSNPSLTTAAALWAHRHSQHLKNSHSKFEKADQLQDNLQKQEQEDVDAELQTQNSITNANNENNATEEGKKRIFIFISFCLLLFL